MNDESANANQEAMSPEPQKGQKLALSDEARVKEVLDQQQYVTGRIGESCRYICFGLLAAFYAIEDSDKAFSRNLLTASSRWLELVALLATLGLFADYFQYLFGDMAVRRAIFKNNHRYNGKWISYRLRQKFYVAKQWLTLGGAIIFAIVVARQVLG